MPHIEAPPNLSRSSLVVRFCETDLMGVVHHANYLTYFELGRVDWLHRRGVPYGDWIGRGIHLPVVETELRYRKPARFGDTLLVDTGCNEITRVTVRFRYKIWRETTLICEGSTLLACVGDDLAPKRFPVDVADVFRRVEPGENQPPSGAPASSGAP